MGEESPPRRCRSACAERAKQRQSQDFAPLTYHEYARIDLLPTLYSTAYALYSTRCPTRSMAPTSVNRDRYEYLWCIVSFAPNAPPYELTLTLRQLRF